jgi:putative ABC transport system ATP-binding protein
MLRAVGLVKAYRGPAGPVTVLRGVDLAVKGGELVVIAGASGSGKSTLLNVVGLLEDADGGEVWFGDDPVSRRSRSGQGRARGRHVGFVFQSFLLLPSLTALENVMLAGRYVGLDRALARRRARELLERLGVSHRQDHFPAQLSGGEQQRVAYCRAILNDPPLLLADEPTGNLDDANATAILEGLRERARAGHAVVVVSHRPEVVEGATAVLLIRDGRLAAGAGPPGTLARRPSPVTPAEEDA